MNIYTKMHGITKNNGINVVPLLKIMDINVVPLLKIIDSKVVPLLKIMIAM